LRRLAMWPNFSGMNDDPERNVTGTLQRIVFPYPL
jgi:hypothetical protein